MAFSSDQRALLLGIRGVGATVIARLEQIGIDSLETLAKARGADITAQVAAMLGASCWRNSPQSQAAIAAAIDAARIHCAAKNSPKNSPAQPPMASRLPSPTPAPDPDADPSTHRHKPRRRR
ncbi:MAG: hypothetical protein ACREO8_01640 [Luteimonas sp.]